MAVIFVPKSGTLIKDGKASRELKAPKGVAEKTL